MSELIFHIGLGKCASSTIQNNILKDQPGYLGTARGMGNDNFAKLFQKFSPVDVRIYGSLERARSWAEKVKEIQSKKNPNLARYIVSSEIFTQPNRIHNRPIIPFLKEFSDKVWYNEGKVKILLILRNQPDKLASSYAQRSGKIFGASQEDFENEINAMIRKNDAKINWSLWVEELYQAFGRENVCVLLMEEINSVKFWEEFRDFMKLENFDPQQMIVKDSKRSNVRSSGENVWKLRPLEIDDKSKKIANRVVEFLGASKSHYHAQTTMHKAVRNVSNTLYSIHPKQMKERNRGAEIKMTSELRERILDYCRPFNKRLSELLSRDLSKVGY
jgi:hypothetical protein